MLWTQGGGHKSKQRQSSPDFPHSPEPVECKPAHTIPVSSPVKLSEPQGMAVRVHGGDRDRQWAIVQVWVLGEQDSDPSWLLHTYAKHIIFLCLSFPSCRWHSW